MTDLHLDEETLQTLKEVMEDDFELLITTYINDTRERLDNLIQEHAANNADGVREAAHSIKGSSSNIGAPKMADLLLRVEEKGKLQDLSGVSELLTEIEKEYTVVVDLLKKI